MLVVDGTSDDAVARLGRLMYNIERGERVFEWAPGSGAAAAADPEPDFLAIEVPGVTAAAPASRATYRPTVGCVYYVPGGDLDALVEGVRHILAALPDDHLRGFLTVEASPHASLHHRGRVADQPIGLLKTFVSRASHPYRTGWDPLKKYPARCLHPVRRENMPFRDDPQTPVHKSLPSHVSFAAAFTWHFIPVSVAARIRTLTTLEEFNAVTAAVFFDTLGGAGDPGALPLYRIDPGFFGVPPPPANLAKTLSGPMIFVWRGGRLRVAGAGLSGKIPSWKPPAPLGDTEWDLVAGQDAADETPTCGYCEVVLFGDDVYALHDDLIAPYFMPMCEWCCGCLPAARAGEVSRTRLPEPAPAVSPELKLLLAADVELLAVDAEGAEGAADLHRVGPFLLVKAEGVAPFIVESKNTYQEEVPPCARAPALRNHKYGSLPCPTLVTIDA